MIGADRFDVADFDTEELELLDEAFGLTELAKRLPECARCTTTPADRDELVWWASEGTWGPFYEDGSPGGFCPSCDTFVHSPD